MIVLTWIPGESAFDYATRVIVHNIVHLELAPGSEVSSKQLCGELSLSRTPIREALNGLSRMGLVEVLPKRGTSISRIDCDVLQESQFMRLVLETAVVRLACRGISQESVEALQKNLEVYRKVCQEGDEDHALEVDKEFHRLIYAAVHKTWICGTLRCQMVHFDRLRRLSMSVVNSKLSDTLKEHEDILCAITRQDEEMAEMMVNRHMDHSLKDLPQVMDRFPDYFVQQKPL